MLKFHSFVFSPFQENTYVIWDETKECAIIDPGCYDQGERGELKLFIEEQGLKPTLLLNTHAHLDHIFGNQFVKATWDVPLCLHKEDLPTLRGAAIAANLYGLNLTPSPEPDQWLEAGKKVKVGNTELEVLFVPGHAPGHVAFFEREQKLLFSGDVLFRGGIGRTDLPGGNMETLMRSIFERVLPLGDEVRVFSGHGPETDIGTEKRTNYFILQHSRA